jgi:hypothetical protein
MRKKIALSIMLLGIIVLVSGCGGMVLSVLKKDELGKENGIAMIHVRIKDPSRSFKYTVLSIESEDDHLSYLTFFVNAWSEANQDFGWKVQDGVNVFDHYFFVEGRPGRYFIKEVTMHYALPGEHGERYYFELPINRAFDMKKGGVVICGVADFSINKVEGKSPNLHLDYASGFMQSDAETAATIEQFKSNYSSLYKTYLAQGPVGRSFFGYRANLQRTEGHKEWASYDGKNFTVWRGGGLWLEGSEKDKNKHGYTSGKNMMNLPKNMNIESSMRWVDGVKDAFYGMRIGIDAKNAYYFGVSASGSPVVWIIKNGEYQQNPAVKKPGLFYASKEKQDVFRIEIANDQIAFRINNEPIGAFKGALDISKAYIGYFVSGSQKVHVDAIQITEGN